MPQQTEVANKQMSDLKMGQFFMEQLKDIYWAEQHLVKTLPKMQKAATSDTLKRAFEDHLAQTKEQVARIETIFDMLDMDHDAEKCDAIAGITDEGEDMIDETEEGTYTRDVALILAGQKAEHYEITTYGGLKELANCLGRSDIAAIFEQTLTEEKDADRLLSQIAQESVNEKACVEMA